ncbi:MAG: stage IV sporulation protein A [Lachnospiraceae bacterium]|nr:stage IV sporulation protein A [Lachnospiraceae bacterium]
MAQAYNMYQDMKERTNGQLYIGVVGPVRTGKSTFIKRFVDLCILPNLTDPHEAARLNDELPQSSGGRTITTTEPKFIPKEAADILLGGDVPVKVRLIDCVGYMVEGAAGHMEEGQERMVHTPWYEEEIPFTKAAQIGTTKVIEDHATVGLLITTDGSFSELPREAYEQAEEKTVSVLSREGKPYLILLNSAKPYSEETKLLAAQLEEKYKARVLPVNCEQLKEEDIRRILETLLWEFPLMAVEFDIPKWVEMLPLSHPVKASLLQAALAIVENKNTIRSMRETSLQSDCEYLAGISLKAVSLAEGKVGIAFAVKEVYYYDMLSEYVGEPVRNEYQLMEMLQDLSGMRREYGKVLKAMEQVRHTGYGVVMPSQEEITLDDPELIKHGSKFGVKIKAKSPSIHLIRAGIETEIAPIVGTKEQAEDLITYIKAADVRGESVWDTNIFGKTVEQLVQEGIQTKISHIEEESQVKLQESMQKIVNDMNGGMVCIII